MRCLSRQIRLVLLPSTFSYLLTSYVCFLPYKQLVSALLISNDLGRTEEHVAQATGKGMKAMSKDDWDTVINVNLTVRFTCLISSCAVHRTLHSLKSTTDPVRAANSARHIAWCTVQSANSNHHTPFLAAPLYTLHAALCPARCTLNTLRAQHTHRAPNETTNNKQQRTNNEHCQHQRMCVRAVLSSA